MAQNYDPKYDTEPITLGYLKKVLGEESFDKNSNMTKVQLSKNYGSTPIPPYNEGDTWTTKTKIYKCIKSRKLGSFTMEDWVEIYDKETSTAISNSFQFLSSVKLIDNSDNKVETFYLESDPAIQWLTDEEKAKHLGDYYQNSKDFKTYIYVFEEEKYKWNEIKTTTIIFDSSTTHKNIFLKRPSEYAEGDIWKVNNIDDVNLLKDAQLGDFFKARRTNQLFSEIDWEKITNELSLKGNIYSSAGIKISGGDLLANLQYVSNGDYNGYSLLGFNKYYGVSGVIKSYADIAIDIDLPDNFKIVSAYLTMFHTPVYWSYWNESTGATGDNWGYSRNVKLYKMNSEKNFKLYMAFANEYRCEINSNDLTEIPNAFKTVSYNPPNQSETTIERKTTINLKSFINITGKTKLVLRSADSVPDDEAIITQKTGMARAVVNVLGYIDPKE